MARQYALTLKHPSSQASIAPLVLHIAGLDDTKKFIRTFETVRAGNTVPARRIGTNDDPPPTGIWYTRSPCNVDYSTPVVGTITPAAYTTSPKMDFTNCGYTPDQIRQAYGVNKVASTGKGIRIGLVDLYVSSTLEQDLNQYSRRCTICLRSTGGHSRRSLLLGWVPRPKILTAAQLIGPSNLPSTLRQPIPSHLERTSFI